ncbi:tetratricopeptide repeat protein [Granulicella tundricola]|uniref:Tetratricopeptide TPR_1 repeat-containing protein n=1 Tax=Granulicella tundricola (strain ATCC BAA-1859 / DSM 23138 / MP5ACTX9) TaxID=1198114 RepID=E8X419_GRATM|nr:tetratricopeptide repeat protein [Granulicella tundricola]ADW70527.1 Tetratricopeptide TPR_1 repeat-containing protein [Granulicella tundricola MP5ACTX9]
MRFVGSLMLWLAGVAGAQSAPTWRHDVAPVLYQSCTGCHHTGGSGPFALMTYAEAKRFASVIDTAVTTRYMPPWLPEEGHGRFQGDRHLPAETVALLHRWIAAGAIEGAGPVAKAPVYTSAWQLGEPDLIVETQTAVSVPASGSDFFTNVILPNPLAGTHWVRAMEIKPGNPQVVHHANVLIDRTASLRRTHPEWRRGVPGMDIEVDSGDDFDPDSHFLFWKPDSTALVEAPGMPWRLDAGNDLVLNLHLKPSGKAETTRARIGLYFTKTPAELHPMLLQLEHDAALNIPAGDASFPVEDALTLPVAVSVLGVYPHAHYLARRMEGWAVTPDGARRDLILIPEWDIDRQSVYRLAEPMKLPGGSVLHMRYVYDNSTGNIHNPHSPPVVVRAGNRSEDEMAHLWVQVLPEVDTLASRQALEGAWMSSVLRKNPGDAIALYNLAALKLSTGAAARAVELYTQLDGLTPGSARVLTALGSALQARGDDTGAKVRYEAALKVDGGYTDAAFDLATLDVRLGDAAGAKPLLVGMLARHPEDAEAHHLLALVYAGGEEFEEALVQLRAWEALAAKDPEPHRALAQVLSQMGRGAEALREQQQVVALALRDANDWNDLGVMEARAGDKVAARRDFLRALEINPGLTEARGNLGHLKPLD